MTPNEYQKEALRTASGMSKEYPRILNGLMGLNGEAGECIDILKKTEFQGHAFDPMKMVDELGDVLWYVAQLATGLGVTLEYVAQHNVDKLLARYPDGFDSEKSIHRKEYENA
jgi:NTP pyrophosphatase (non-canonical NTP hydrolase)